MVAAPAADGGRYDLYDIRGTTARHGTGHVNLVNCEILRQPSNSSKFQIRSASVDAFVAPNERRAERKGEKRRKRKRKSNGENKILCTTKIIKSDWKFRSLS